MPSSSIACLEHVNINSDSPIEACTFYLDGMGFVQDPRQGALVAGKVYINNVMWLTAGINQLHIPITSRGCSGAERNVLRGIIGLAYEDIEGLCSRLESIETALAGTQFRWSMRDESTVDICGPDGNRFLAHQQPASARDTRGFHPGPPSLCLGFQYVELDCPTGAAPAIAAYYKHYFEAAVEVRQQGLPAQTAVILTGGTEHCTELRYAERADYACTPEAPYSLASYGIHLCVYMPDELLPLTMQRLADDGLLWDNPRFGSLDRSLGSSQFRCKDIVDVKARKRHEGPLPLVMEMEHEVRLASHDTSPFLAQEPYTVAGREPVPRLVVSEVSSFEKDWPAVRAEKNAATVGYMPSAMLVHDVDIDDVEYLRHDDKPFLATIFKPLGQGPFPVVLEVCTEDVGVADHVRRAGRPTWPWRRGALSSWQSTFGLAHIRPRWPTSTTRSVGRRGRLRPGTACRSASGSWEPRRGRTKRCCSACAPAILATPCCHRLRDHRGQSSMAPSPTSSCCPR